MKKVLLTVSAFACVLTGLAAVACDKTEKVSYKFDTLCNGEVSVDDVTVNKGTEFTLPEPASRGKEWEFAGWYPSADFSGSPVTSVSAEAGATYYAKWDRLYKLNLNLGGGTLAGADDLYLKAGASLSDYAPSKTGYKFGEWLNEESKAVDKMPAGPVTLTARYMVSYTLDVYTQSIAYLRGESGAEEFEKEEKWQPTDLYHYAGEKFTISYSLQGFECVGGDLEAELEDEPREGDNVFALYFNRNSFRITLNPNIEGTSQKEIVADYYYDEAVELPYDCYTNVGYVFAGWSASSSGGNDYPIDFIDAVLYNKVQDDGSEVKRKEFRVQRHETLYAYWNKGYSDLFGGADTIFLLNDASQNIYLFRGGKYFKGEYDSGENEFAFFDKNNTEILFEGKLLGNNTFCYSNESRLEVRANRYTSAGGVNGDITLGFGMFDEVTYTVKGEDERSSVASGAYTIDTKTGEFTAVFESSTGEQTDWLVGETVRFVLGSVSGKPVFMIRDEEEFALGTLKRFAVYNNSLTTYRNSYYDLTFDGYGNAVYKNFDTDTSCKYVYDEAAEAYKLTDAKGKAIGTGYVKLMNVDGKQGYMFFVPALKGDFACGDGKLVLDGTATASYYVSDALVASGYFTASASYVGNYTVTLNDNGADYTFLLKSYTEGTGEDRVTVNTATIKLAGYAEYVYYDKNEKGEYGFYYPVLVLDDEERGKANLYVNVGGVLTKGASGTYTLDNESGLYTLTDIRTVEGVSFAGSKLALDEISAFVFALDTSNTSSNIYYLYSQTNSDSVASVAEKKYVPVDKDGETLDDGSSLSIVGGIAIFTDKSGTYVGTYRTDGGTGITRIAASENGGVRYIYVAIGEAANDGENGTFLRCEAPYKAYLYKEDGTAEQYETMVFDGKGGVTYSYRETPGDKDSTVTYTGSVEDTGEKTVVMQNQEVSIYLFTGSGESGTEYSFRYILIANSSNIFFSKISDKAGEFTSGSGARLTLDGTGFGLTYSDTYNHIYKGIYRARTDTIVYTYIDGEYLYFELDTANKTFAVIGSEYGAYIVIDNQVTDGRYVEFDGKGAAKIYKMPETSNDDSTEIATGTYRKNEDGTFTIEYTVGTAPYGLTGRLGTIQSGSSYYSAFFIRYDSVADTYVNEADYTVLVLSDTGSAIRYLQNGGMERGSYIIITDESQGAAYNILYYINANRTFAAIYEYNAETKLVSVAPFYQKLAYCNEELSTLMFTEYGFAIFDGTTQYYYYQEGDDIVIYRLDKGNENANAYGFVKEGPIEGGFKDTINYNDVDYYRNSGFDVTLNYKENSAGNKIFFPEEDKEYGLESITFALSGSSEFSVSGKASLKSGETKLEKDCTIVRKLTDAENKTYETYVMIGFYRYDIDVSYHADIKSRTFTPNSMRYLIEADAYNYLYTMQMYAMFFGAAPAIPSFAHITVWRDYNADGTPQEMYMSGTFNKDYYPLCNEKGEILDFEKVPCEIDENGFYSIAFENGGYTYKGDFVIDAKSFSQKAFRIARFYREQTLTSGNDTITVGRIIASDVSGIAPGALTVLTLNDIEATATLKINDEWHIVKRTYGEEDNGKVVSTSYYKVALKEKAGADADNKFVMPYESAEVTSITVDTVYAADGRYVDIADGKVMAIVRTANGKESYIIIKDSTYDSGTQTYTVTATSGKRYTVKVGNDSAEIEEIASAE